MYLLDTNICIFAINEQSENVLMKIKANMRYGIYLSSLTVAELEYGVENSEKIDKNRIALIKFISPFTIINFDDKDASAYGKIKVKLKKAGTIIGPIDMLLAAQSVSKKLIMVTNNVKEFSRIEELKVDDWSMK